MLAHELRNPLAPIRGAGSRAETVVPLLWLPPQLLSNFQHHNNFVIFGQTATKRAAIRIAEPRLG
jgi:signal transduction histidine kinase